MAAAAAATEAVLSASWHVAEKAKWRGESVARASFLPTQRLVDALNARPDLPDPRSLLDGWACTVREHGGVEHGKQAGWLGVSATACVLFIAGDHDLAVAEPWQRVTIPIEFKRNRLGSLMQSLTPRPSSSQRSEPKSVVLYLAKQGFTISGLASATQTLEALDAIQASYMKGWVEGPGRWMPRSIVLHAPLTITNRLPCVLSVTLMPTPRSSSVRTFASFFEVVEAAKKASDASDPDDECSLDSSDAVPVEIPPGETEVCTSVHPLQPLTASVSVVGHRRLDEPRRARLPLHRNALLEQLNATSRTGEARMTEGSFEVQLTLRHGGGGLSSTTNVLKLRVLVSMGVAGQVGLTFEAPHAFQNLSSLPLRLHPAQQLSFGAAAHVAQIEPGEGVEVPFSTGGARAQLSTWTMRRRKQIEHTRSRLNLMLRQKAPKDKLRSAAASAISHVWRGKRADRSGGQSQLTRPFSILESGTEQLVQIVHDGKLHEVCVHVGSPPLGARSSVRATPC
jgi:hypothetical protein